LRGNRETITPENALHCYTLNSLSATPRSFSSEIRMYVYSLTVVVPSKLRGLGFATVGSIVLELHPPVNIMFQHAIRETFSPRNILRLRYIRTPGCPVMPWIVPPKSVPRTIYGAIGGPPLPQMIPQENTRMCRGCLQYIYSYVILSLLAIYIIVIIPSLLDILLWILCNYSGKALGISVAISMS